MRSFATARRLAAHWLVDFPPLYFATIALVIGDALGNAGVYVSLDVAIAIALIATAAYLTAHPAAGIALAFIAIGAAATVPVRQACSNRRADLIRCTASLTIRR